MKRVLTLLITLVSAAAFATGQPAQVATSTVVNSGSISNSVRTDASVIGLGTSYSSATSAAGSTANGAVTTVINPVCSGTCGAKSGSYEMSGVVSTYNNATAFNVSTGAGSGTASSSGHAKASLTETAKYTGPGQTLSGDASLTANSSVNVDAAKNTGGVSAAESKAETRVLGSVGSKVCTGTGTPCGASTTKEVWGAVSDTKSALSSAATGNMTVDGTVLAPANTSATANSTANVNAYFSDPI